MRRILLVIVLLLALLVVATIGGSYYMLDYSLASAADRADTASCFRRLVERHPEIKPWLDSLNSQGALRDTFVDMPTGERHHGYYVRCDSSRQMAIILHGWRNCGIDILHIGRIYEQMGYSILLPDLHAHGLSEGELIGMGWNDRLDVLHWMTLASRLFGADDVVVHGISMGAATTMCVAGEQLPQGVRSARFVEDCGYTSVWDEFHYELAEEFGLPDFPLMYATSLLCRLKDGWTFGEAAPIDKVRQCRWPMLFIHGDNDTFVPSWMVHPLYEAKPGQKSLWVTKGTIHAKSYTDYTQDYIARVRQFCSQP